MNFTWAGVNVSLWTNGLTWFTSIIRFFPPSGHWHSYHLSTPLYSNLSIHEWSVWKRYLRIFTQSWQTEQRWEDSHTTAECWCCTKGKRRAAVLVQHTAFLIIYSQTCVAMPQFHKNISITHEQRLKFQKWANIDWAI